jgi:hypothetical protein
MISVRDFHASRGALVECTGGRTKCGLCAGLARKASRLLKSPVIAKAVAEIRSDARREAVYTLLEAVKEIDKAVLFAYGQKNAMAIAKLLESKGKLFGLYVDRYQEVPVDLKGALAEARGVDDPAMSLSADGFIKWAPHIAGDNAQ